MSVTRFSWICISVISFLGPKFFIWGGGREEEEGGLPSVPRSPTTLPSVPRGPTTLPAILSQFWPKFDITGQRCSAVRAWGIEDYLDHPQRCKGAGILTGTHLTVLRVLKGSYLAHSTVGRAWESAWLFALGPVLSDPVTRMCIFIFSYNWPDLSRQCLLLGFIWAYLGFGRGEKNPLIY